MPSQARQLVPAPWVTPYSAATGFTICRAAGGQEGLILTLECSFGHQATSILIASVDIAGEESKVLACFGQPQHPTCLLSPGPALVAGREDFRAAEVPQLLSHHPHVAAHEQLCEQPALGPAMFWAGGDAPSNP